MGTPNEGEAHERTRECDDERRSAVARIRGPIWFGESGFHRQYGPIRGFRSRTVITPEMCREMHHRLGKRGPVAANSALQSFNTVWNYARRMDRNLPESPAAGLEWFPEQKTLNAPIRDLPAWKAAVDKIENPVHRAAYM